MQTPTPGQVIQGYVFNGGDPADPSSWTPEAGAVQQPSSASGMPQPGQVMDGYIFKGGNPADPVSWVPETESRGFFDVIKDTGLEATSAAASGVGALTEFVAPGNRFAQGVDNFTKTLGEMQTPQTQAAKLAFAQQMEEAEGVGDEVSAVLSYALENPLLAAAQAAGSFVIPGTTIKGAGLIARGLGAGARGTRAAGVGAGVATGAALGGGEAGGTAYELVMQTPDETLDTQEEFQQLIGAGMEREQAKEVLATTAARKAQILPTLVGGAFGAVGVERLLAGAGGYSGSIAARAFKGFGSEAVQEGIEEGVTTFEGQRAAAEVNPEIDPSKGVAGAVTFGAILGGTTGAGVAALSRSAEQLEAERDKLLEERITKAATVEEAIRAAEEMADVNAAIPDLDQALAQYSSRAIEEAETDPTAMRAGPSVTPLAEGEQVQDRLEQAAASPVELDPVVERLQSASRQGEIRLPEEVNQTVTQIQNAIARRNGVALPAEAEFLQRYNLGTPFDRVARPEEIGLAPPPAQQIQPAQSETIQTLRDQPRESTRLQQPRAFTPTPELQGARIPAPEIPVIDRTQAAVNVAARTNTPAAQAFAGQARREEITPQDVQASLAAQDREGFEIDNRLQAAAQQAQPVVDVTAQRIEQAAAATPVSNVTQITGRLQTLAEAGFAERQGRIQVQRSPAREVNGTLDLGQGRVARIVTRDQLSLDAPVIKTATNVRQQISRSQYDVLNRVAKVFGKEVKVIEGANLDAFVNESTPNTIYVNKETSIQPTSLVFHEMAHLLQKDNREAYDALKDVVLAQASEQDRKAFADYYEAGSEFDADELVADSFGSILAKPETLNQVFSNISQTYGTNRARAIVTRLAASLTRVINRVLKTFKTKDYKTVGAFVGKTEQDLQTLKEAVTQAATTYARQQRPVVQAQAAPAVQSTQPAATPSRVMFEVAPDPRNAELKQRWDALPVQEKNAISAEVAQEVMPEVLRKAGVKGTVQPQFGGWMDDTNPSFAVISDDPKGVVEAAKLAGYGLRQESVMVIQGKAFEKSLPTGVISITLPSSVNGKDLNAVSDFYRTVRAVNPELIQGHTTVGQDMILAVPPESVEALARSIAEVTPEGTTVTSNDAFVAFYDQGDYDYGNIQGAQRETVRFANSVRSKTDESLRRISERGNRPAETQTAQAASTVRAETGRTKQDRVRFSTRRAVQEVKDYARQFEPDFFRTPKSNSVAMEDIVADIAPSVTTQRMPEGFYPDADETFTLDIAGRMAFISRKENAVWVNVGDLEPGLDGARVYQIAGAFAYNNGYTLIGDPVSISEAGKLRRLENMISLSLKYGSSDFMKPHDQMLGWKGLMWSGTSDDKLAFLLRTSQRVVREQVPEALNVKFNPDTGEFTNSAGQTMGPADFADMARQARVGKTETEREGMPGSGTVRLAVVFNSLLERAGINQPETAGTLPDQSSRRTETLRTNLSGIRASTRRDQTETPEFKRWAGTSSRVIEPEEINDTSFSGEGPFVLKVYHGTTNSFYTFDASKKGNLEGKFGAVNYFTSDEFDARVNYATQGPDLTNRIEFRAERLADEITDFYEENGEAAVREKYGEAVYNEDFLKMARSIISKELDGGERRVLELYVKTKKPFVLRDGKDSWIELFNYEELRSKAVKDVAEENGVSEEVAKTEFEDEVDEAFYANLDQSDNVIADAIDKVARRYGVDSDSIKQDLGDVLFEPEISNEEFYKNLLMSETLTYAESQNAENMVGPHLIGEIIKEMGYDSIILKNADVEFNNMVMKKGTAHVHVFNATPSNIKSATENIGSFDALNPDIRFSTERETAFEVAQPSRVDNVVRKLQDKNVDLKRVQEAIKKESGPIEEEADAYLKEELYHGRAAKQSVDFLNFQLTPLLQELRMRKVPLKDFEMYLWNRHAEERNEQIAKVNDRFPDGGSGIPTEKAREYLAGLSDSQRKTYEALAARVDRMVNENLQMMVDTGLESQETVNAMKQAYRNYVPLMRAESASYTGRGQGYSIRGATTKRALGSDKPVDNILASLVDQREKIITRAEKARVGRALMGLALQNPNEDFWFVFDPLLNKAERTAAQRVELRNQLERLGFDPELAEEISSQPYTEEMGPSGKVVLRPNRKLMEAPNAVAVRINGEDKFVVMNQENERARKMAEALTNLDAPKLEGAMGILAKASRYFASINTQYNPVFGIINLMRDTQGAMVNLTSTEIAGEQVKVTRGIGPALKATYDAARARRSGKLATGEWADLYDRFQNVGAQTGFRDMFDNPTQRTQRQLKAIAEPGPWRKLDEKVRQPIFNWLSDYNESLENAVRLSAFKAALDKGLSDERAASIAKNLTVNFNRKGQIGAQAGAVYAFYNASVQGTARLIEALNGPKGRQILAGGLLLGASQPLILALAGFDDEQPPEFVRERNLVIPVPGGDGKFISVPMPLGLHVIPNVGRIAMEQVMGRTQQNVTESLGKLFLTVVGAFNPIGTGTFLQTLSPTVLDPAVALSENKDFAGRPIAREDFSSNKPTPGYTRTKENSIDTLIPVSKALNYLTGGSEFTKGMVSPTPDQIEYAIAQLTGGVGREISKVVQVAETSVTGEELPIYKRPLIGRLYGDANTQASQAGQFYENLRALHDHKLEIEGRVEAGRPYQDYVTENPEAALYKMAERVEREVQKLRRNKRLLKERGAGPETIRQIEDAITAKMNRLNEQVKWIRNQTT